MKSALVPDLGLDPAHTPDYLALERNAKAQGDAARRALGSSYAGDWIELNSDGSATHVVATSGTGNALAAQSGVELRRVRYSLTQLQNSFNALEASARNRVVGISKSIDGVNSMYVDPKLNSVVVSVAPGAIKRATDLISASVADTGEIQLVSDPGAPKTLVLVQGGIEYQFRIGTGTYVCSVGFPVTKDRRHHDHQGIRQGGTLRPRRA